MTAADGGGLPEHVLLFGRALRAAGLAVGPAQILAALRAAARVGLRRPDDFRIALRAAMLDDPRQFRLFDRAFHAYFRDPRRLERLAPAKPPAASRHGAEGPAASAGVAAAGTGSQAPSGAPPASANHRPGGYSAAERLKKKDFEDMSDAEERAAAALLRAELLPLRETASRRFHRHPLGDRPDPRQTMRQMLRNDGQLLTLERRRRRRRPPGLVLLCDVSGSMSRYSRMFLRFAHTLTSTSSAAHSFVFATRLSNVTRRLRTPDFARALSLAAAEVQDWDGGTRIAACLEGFNRDWARRLLARSADVVLLSDGLERDTGSDLEFQIARLHRSCRQLIWLNPMLRYDRFEPAAFGIRTMLPHVDLFLPAHDVESLGDLARILSQRRSRPRPITRQVPAS